MMKRLFFFFSSLLLSLFLGWVIIETVPQMRYDSYPTLFIHRLSSEEAEEAVVVGQELELFAQKTNSLIVKRLALPQKNGQANFFYQSYGQGELPKGFSLATAEMVSQYQEQLTSYAIVRGEVSIQELVQFFADFGYQAIPSNPASPWLFMPSALSRGSQFLALLICWITFVALTLIYRIDELRSVGIKLLSGATLLGISGASVFKDVKETSLATCLAGIVGSLFLASKGVLDWLFLSYLICGLLVYQASLLVLSLILTIVYFIGVRRTKILPLIKGKLPLTGLLLLMFTGQFLAISVVGLSWNRVIIYHQELKKQESAMSSWDDEADLVSLSFNLAVSATDKRQHYFKKWYPLMDRAVDENLGLMVKHNLASFIFDDKTGDGIRETDYHPDGKTLYVTPGYLIKQGISLDSEIQEQLFQLSNGQFGLLLPENLKQDEETYKALYSAYLGDQFASGSINSFTPIVGFIPNHQNYFIYNQTAMLSQQYITDPVIVVVTPESTGYEAGSVSFWGNAINDHFFFQDYEIAQQLIQDEGLSSYVSYIENSKTRYQQQLLHLKSERLLSLAGALLGIGSSVLLFQSMNLIYFEQFKRELTIKRLSGLSFIALHKDYLTAQLSTFLLAFSLLTWLRQPFWLNSWTLGVFGLASIFTLLKQAKKDETGSIAVLKGA